MGWWDGGDFVVENYATGRQATLSPGLAPLLAAMGDECSLADIAQRFGHVPDIAALIDRLIQCDILLMVGTDAERLDANIVSSWRWGHPARYFHFSTRRTVFDGDPLHAQDALRARARHSPPPPPFLHRKGTTIPLPRDAATVDMPVAVALLKRRTVRRFAHTSLDQGRFARILELTWLATNVIEDPWVGQHILRTSPSGGARHPIEVYPVVLSVDDLAPGIYHYACDSHSLELVSTGDYRDLVADLCGGQAWVSDTSSVFFMTAVLQRSMWKYGQDHAYRVVHLDAGHLGQTFHLVATALGLAPFTTGAFDHAGVERALQIDGVGEVPIYAGAVGMAEPSS